MKLKIIILFTAVVLSSIFTACSNKPPNKKVLTAIIKTQIEKRLPGSWNESFLKGENVKVDLIKILQLGKFNKSEKYWPVKAHVVGTYQINVLVKTLTKHFNKIGDFKIFKDDYGNWQAAMSNQ